MALPVSFRARPERPRLVPVRETVPAVVRLQFDPHALDPETRHPCLGVVLEDAETREPFAARRLHEAADWLRSHGFRFAGVNGVWIRN